MNWISVKDRLPDHQNDILIYSKRHDILTVGYYGEDGRFADRDDIYVQPIVTHWQEIEPPK